RTISGASCNSPASRSRPIRTPRRCASACRKNKPCGRLSSRTWRSRSIERGTMQLEKEIEIDSGTALRDKFAIVGVGETAYVRGAKKTTRQLAHEAVSRAMADAGLGPHEVDGMLSYQ